MTPLQSEGSHDTGANKAEHEARSDAPARSVTPRAVLIAFALIPANAYWIVQMELVRYSAHPTTISLFFNAIFILVVITAINRLVRKRFPSAALNQGELLLIYAVLTIASCVCSHDFLEILIPHLVWMYYPDSAANPYRLTVWPHIASWVMMPDTAAAKAFMYGKSSLYTRQNLIPWLRPVAVWTVFTTVLLFVMQCVNVIIRKRWTDDERLAYPIVKLPLEITSGDAAKGPGYVSFLRSPLFWIAFVLASGNDVINSLAYVYPQVPHLMQLANGQVLIDLGTLATQKPWSAIGWTPVTCYPFVIGMGMLMPTDFLFSCWFFYAFWKLQAVFVVAEGWDFDTRMPYANYQAFGAYMLFFVSTIIACRPYLRKVWACALGDKTEIDDSGEPVSYRFAIVGIVAGVLALSLFAVSLGMTWWLALVFFCIYFALSLAICRMRAELGTPVHDLHFTGPDWLLADLIGPRALGAQNLGVLSVFYWFNRAYRSHPMPAQLEAFKMATESGANRELRRWFWVMIAAGAFGTIAGIWALLHCFYIYGATVGMSGAAGAFGSEAWNRYQSWTATTHPATMQVSLAIAAGFAFAALLQAFRLRLAWFPFHPLAFAVSGSWEMNNLWAPLMVAYFAKTIILRYGGIDLYRRSLPFAYGLILGQFLFGSVLNIWGIATNNPTYQFWQ
jgi:hypothetical protein